jgi:pyruvate/2-oxoglutarate dehydrogenase complex dihydrolipoamide dehydrogenase (E3) component
VRAWFNHFERNGCAEALVLVEIFAAQGVVALHVGRTPNGKKIAADKAGVAVTDRGFINVDIQMRTNVPHIFAIGDIVGQPMLAHKAVHEAHVAAEVIAGELQGNKELASRRLQRPPACACGC